MMEKFPLITLLEDREMDYGRLRNILRELVLADVNQPDSYIKIKELTTELLGQTGIPGMYLPAGTFLCRGRINKRSGLFTRVEELSYRPDSHNITEFGRANEPKQPTFYASITRPTATLETLYQYDPDFGTQTVTVGIWKAIAPIILARFISGEEEERIERGCWAIGFPCDSILTGHQGSGRKFMLKLCNFYSGKFTEQIRGNPNEYMFTAAVANFVFGSAADGLMYDSVKYPHCQTILHSLSPSPARELSGLEEIMMSYGLLGNLDHVNVALSPRAVANKLVFHDALCMTMTQTAKAEYVETGTRRALSILDGRVYWNGSA